MVERVWISKDDAVLVHGRQLAVHGGPEGIRDEGLLGSALARAENLFAYGDPDLADLAAATPSGSLETIRSSTVTNVRRLRPARPFYG